MSAARQAKAMRFIVAAINANGESPTYREIGDHLGVSAAAAFKVVESLIGQKRLLKKKGLNRNLAIVGTVDLRDIPTADLKTELERRGTLFESASAINVVGGRPCAATGCPLSVARGHLFCKRHYYQIPATIRGNMLAAYGRTDRRGFERWFAAAKDSLAQDFFEKVVERTE